MNPSIWSLSQRVRALSAAVATVIGLLALAAVVTAAADRSENLHVTTHLTPALISKERLVAELLRQQSSARTYALSGRDEDVRVYDEAIDRQGELIRIIERLLSTEPALRSDLKRAEAELRSYREQVTGPLVESTRRNGASPALAVQDGQATAAFQRAADALGHFGNQLFERRLQVLRRVQSTSNTLIWLLVAAALTIIIAGATLAALLRRMVTYPVTALAADVRRVARGDYEYEISGSGAPELAELAYDVNAMRQQIASDLAEVRGARRHIEAANAQLEQTNQQLADANQQLAAQTEELTRSNRDLEQFAYVASHDLQEPLRKVASFCQLLQRRYADRLDERADQYIAFAVDGAQRMQRLINDLLAFSRIGRITSGRKDVDLNAVMREVASELEARRQEVDGEITWDELPVVRGEEALLQALLANLVGNSLKFYQPGSPARVHLTSRRVDDEWEICCRDNGIGIAPEFADKVFVIFQRLHTKETYSGTGIGLAVAKKVVEYHGGRIWVDAEYRDGTLVRFTLPVSPAGHSSAGHQHSSAGHQQPGAGHQHSNAGHQQPTAASRDPAVVTRSSQ